MLSYYFDHHVKRDIADGLRRRGIDVVTAFEDGAVDWEDERLLERANQLGRVLFTLDDDFLTIAGRWQHTGREFAGIVFAEQVRITVGQCVNDLDLMARVFEPDEMRNRVEFIPL
jgi:predicted nuclease of predicted toxin-antitoxin system